MVLLASQTGNLLNTNELSNTLRLTHAVTDQFLYVLQKCFHISLVKPFFQNIRKELVKMPKVYFNDLGLRNVLVNYFAPLEQRTDFNPAEANPTKFRKFTDAYPQFPLHFYSWQTADLML